MRLGVNFFLNIDWRSLQQQAGTVTGQGSFHYQIFASEHRISDISKLSIFAASLSYAWQRVDFRSVGPKCTGSFTMLLSTCEVEALARLQRPRTLEPQCLNIPWHNFIGMCVLRTLFLLSILYIKKEAPQKEDGHHRAVALNSRIWHVAYRERCDNGKNVGFIKNRMWRNSRLRAFLDTMGTGWESRKGCWRLRQHWAKWPLRSQTEHYHGVKLLRFILGLTRES